MAAPSTTAGTRTAGVDGRSTTLRNPRRAHRATRCTIPFACRTLPEGSSTARLGRVDLASRSRRSRACCVCMLGRRGPGEPVRKAPEPSARGVMDVEIRAGRVADAGALAALNERGSGAAAALIRRRASSITRSRPTSSRASSPRTTAMSADRWRGDRLLLDQHDERRHDRAHRRSALSGGAPHRRRRKHETKRPLQPMSRRRRGV